METSLPVAERPRRPEWMKVRAPSKDSEYFDVQKLIHGLSHHTICEEARCPNISECWGRGTATFQILGDTCTLADYNVLTKSGIIVGLGETNDEVVETLRDLRAHGVDVVTIGQYLQPSPQHATIDRWVHPDEFRWFREQGEALGFGSVFSGPLVRSSYRADEQKHAAATGRGAVAY